VSIPRLCQFVTDKARASDPLRPCFFSRHDGTPLELCSGWKQEGYPSFAHSHSTFQRGSKAVTPNLNF
jgi:hypothetical protein